jgi:transcriptional regulator with XRE-family HTH domain
MSQKHISQIEKGTREPSEQLLKHICLRFFTSENWLKKGEGEMFVSPEEVIKNQIARFDERAVIDAFCLIMKEHGLNVPAALTSAARESAAPYTTEPELARMINVLEAIWYSGDERLKGWASVQFEYAFPGPVVDYNLRNVRLLKKAAQSPVAETYSIGQKPGPGVYRCVVCGGIIQICDPDDTLPPCPHCPTRDYVRLQ